MNLRAMNDRMLLQNTKDLAHKEREVLISLLHHLREIERRRLFCDLKCESMLAYAMKELKYSEAQACRRLAAMRLLRDVPAIESKIESGELNLTNAVLAQTVFSKERKAGRERKVADKMDLLKQLENKSTREATQIVQRACPDLKPKELELFDIKDLELRAKAERVQKKLGITNLTQLLNHLFDQELAKPAEVKSPSAPKVDSVADMRRQVWRRDQNRCCNCGSSFRLQIDHIYPRAAGGTDSMENLRLLCQSCNLRAAVKFYGLVKMSDYVGDLEH